MGLGADRDGGAVGAGRGGEEADGDLQAREPEGPGDITGPADAREFWERAEDRNRATAELYDHLGLPEYQAIEGFVSWSPSEADGSLPGADSTCAKNDGAVHC